MQIADELQRVSSSASSSSSYQTAIGEFQHQDEDTDMEEGVETVMPRRTQESGCVGLSLEIDGWTTETRRLEVSDEEARDDIPAEIKAYYGFVFGHPSERWHGNEEECERPVKTSTDGRMEHLNRPSSLMTIAEDIVDKRDTDQSSSDQEPMSARTFPAERCGDGVATRGTYCGNASLEQWRAAYDLRRTAEDVLIPWFIFYDGPLPWEHAPAPDLVPSPLRIRKSQSPGAALYSRALEPQRDGSRPQSEEQVPSLVSETTVSPQSFNHGPGPLAGVCGCESPATAPQSHNDRISSWIKRLKSRVTGKRHVPVGAEIHAGSELSVGEQKPPKVPKTPAAKTMRKRFSSLRDIRSHFAKFRRFDAPVVEEGADGISRDQSPSQLSEYGAERVSTAALSSALRSLQNEMERGRPLTTRDEAVEYEWAALTPSSFDGSLAETETYASDEDRPLPLRVVNF